MRGMKVRLPSTLDLQVLQAGLWEGGWEATPEEVVFAGAPVRHAEPVGLVMMAAWAARARASGGLIEVEDSPKSPYAIRTNLLRCLVQDLPRVREVRCREQFIPLSWFSGRHDADKVIGPAVVKLLHAPTPRATQAVGAAVKEMAYNASQHGRSSLNAYVAAGWFPRQRRVTFAMADLGDTIHGTMARKGLLLRDDTDAAAIEKALQRGITGAGDVGQVDAPDNGGLGLHLTRLYAQGCGGSMTVWSGHGLYQLHGDRTEEWSLQPIRWPGTTVMVTLRPDQIGQYAATTHDFSFSAHGIRVDRVPDHPGLTLRPPVDSVGFAADKTWYAEHRDRIEQAWAGGQQVLLDFGGARYSTQSALHSLLYLPVRRFGREGTSKLWITQMAGPVDQILGHVLSYSLAAHERGA